MSSPKIHDEEEKANPFATVSLNNNNLYSPFYYGDSHIEVGHPFAITCIVTQTEAVQWQKDGDVIGTGSSPALAYSGNEEKLYRSTPRLSTLRGVEDMLSKGLAERVTRAAGYQNENQINWNIEMQPSMQRPVGLERDRESRPMLDDDRVADFMAVAPSGDESVSEDENDVAAFEPGLRLRLDHNRELREWSGTSVEQESARIKRNVSELEKINLSRYYKAVVDFYNMGGGRSYYVDSFLTDRHGEVEHEKATMEEEHEAEEERNKALHDYIFTQGHVQGTLFSKWSFMMSCRRN